MNHRTRLLTLLGSSLLCIPCFAQDGPLSPHAPTDPSITRGERLPSQLYVDYVIAISSHEPITVSDLVGRMQSPSYDYARRISQGEDVDRVQSDALLDLVEELVQIQAGRDRGFDPEVVSELTARSRERKIQELGGHLALSNELARRQISATDYEQLLQDSLYMEAWKSSLTGDQRGPLGRFSVDNYVRPGMLKSTYDALLLSRNPKEREVLGVRDGSLTLQVVILDVRQFQGRERTLQLAQRLRKEVLEGSTEFSYLVETWSALTENEGMVGPMPTDQVSALSREWHNSDELASFCLTATVGDVSEPVSRLSPNGNEGLCLYRLVERQESSTARPFEDLETQSKLRELVQQGLASERVRRAMREATLGTHVWPAELKRILIEQ